MKLKINGIVVVEGTEVVVSNVADLEKVNEAYRLIRNLLDRYDDIDNIEVERMEEEP